MAEITDIVVQSTAANIEPGFVSISTANYVNYAAPTTVTDTVENGGALNIFMVDPLTIVPISLSVAANLEPGFVLIGTADFQGFAVPVTVTETTAAGGRLDVFIVQPLGQALIREFWI